MILNLGQCSWKIKTVQSGKALSNDILRDSQVTYKQIKSLKLTLLFPALLLSANEVAERLCMFYFFHRIAQLWKRVSESTGGVSFWLVNYGEPWQQTYPAGWTSIFPICFYEYKYKNNFCGKNEAVFVHFDFLMDTVFPMKQDSPTEN